VWLLRGFHSGDRERPTRRLCDHVVCDGEDSNARAGDRGARSGGELALPLAEAKLAVPASRRHVDRPRVRQALAEGRQSALTLVAAPAGYGKTTAVHAWSESLDAALAWVTLDAGDNDPIRLWTYIATAVDRVREGLGRTALQQLSVSASVNERFLDALMNGLAAFAEPLVLVLDDLHAVTEPECLAAIDYALERLPANARLVAITRSDPALRLAQLHAEGKLKEVRAAELAFTVAEARELLVEHFRVELGEEEIALLAERARAGRPCSFWPGSGCKALPIRREPCVSSAVRTASSPSTSATRSSRRSTTISVRSSRRARYWGASPPSSVRTRSSAPMQRPS
jgi:hypothetical protein